MFEIANEQEGHVENGAKIKVIGIGGGGCNAVNTMIRSGLTGVEYIVANTDSQALSASLAPTKVQLGVEITKGLGAGANPEVGRKAALDEYEKLSEVLQGSDMVFITAGMGGGTGTGAAPVIAKLCKELDILTVGVVTKPFLFEGKKRFRQADAGIQVLEENVDSLITIPNQRLLYIAGESLSLVETFKKADEVLLNAVRGISDLINNTGHINADFADVKTVMENKGLSLMGTGNATGPDRAIKAATEAISSPLLEDISIDGATGIIINITGNESLTMHETNEAVTLIMEAADEEAEIIFGTVIDDAMEDEIKVTVVATGLGGLEKVTTSHIKQNKEREWRQENATNSITARSEESTVSYTNEREPQRDQATNLERDAAKKEETFWLEEEKEVELAPKREATQELKKEETSSLMKSIKEAAVNYEANSSEGSTQIQRESARDSQREPQRETQREASKNRDQESARTASRAKSIAEKLGFINFDEEELDRPSYLRKEEKKDSQDRQRPLDI
ncbi:cell division protein FtsZ [Bacteriovoracaceae bacterium]|nr:cell division protein FtsZ [Bacteriovoracaceae bacterium]